MSDMDQPETILLEVPADLKYLETITSMLQAILLRFDEQPKDSQTHFALKLTVHEACTNIIEHAYHGNPGKIRVEILLYLLAKKIVIDLSDQGDATDLSKFESPDLTQPQVRGYGLYLMKQLVDQVDYFREGGTNRWRLQKAL